MSGPKNHADFNGPLHTEPVPLYRTYSIGQEHTLEGEGTDARIVPTLDENGQPIPRTYEIPLVMTAERILGVRRRFMTLAGITGGDDINAVQAKISAWIATAEEHEILMEVLDAVIGDGLIERIATDRTIPPATLLLFLADLADHLDLGTQLDWLFGGAAAVGEALAGQEPAS